MDWIDIVFVWIFMRFWWLFHFDSGHIRSYLHSIAFQPSFSPYTFVRIANSPVYGMATLVGTCRDIKRNHTSYSVSTLTNCVLTILQRYRVCKNNLPHHFILRVHVGDFHFTASAYSYVDEFTKIQTKIRWQLHREVLHWLWRQSIFIHWQVCSIRLLHCCMDMCLTIHCLWEHSKRIQHLEQCPVCIYVCVVRFVSSWGICMVEENEWRDEWLYFQEEVWGCKDSL